MEEDIQLYGPEERLDLTLDKAFDLEIQNNPNTAGEIKAHRKNLIEAGREDLLNKTLRELEDGKEFAALIKAGKFAELDTERRSHSSGLITRLNSVYAKTTRGKNYVKTIVSGLLGPKSYEAATKWSLNRSRKTLIKTAEDVYKKLPSLLNDTNLGLTKAQIKKKEDLLDILKARSMNSQKVIDAAEKQLAEFNLVNERARAMLGLHLFTGFRPSDIARIQPGDFNPDTGQLIVRSEKNAATNVAYLSPSARAFLQKAMALPAEGNTVFPNATGLKARLDQRLTEEFGKVTFEMPEGGTKEFNFTTQTFRNLNETILEGNGTGSTESSMISGRAKKTEAAGYVKKGIALKGLQTAAEASDATVLGYMGFPNGAQFANDTELDNYAPESLLKIVPNKELMVDDDYLKVLPDGFVNSLETGPIDSTDFKPIQTIDPELSAANTRVYVEAADDYAASLNLSAAQKRQKAAEIRAATPADPTKGADVVRDSDEPEPEKTKFFDDNKRNALFELFKGKLPKAGIIGAVTGYSFQSGVSEAQELGLPEDEQTLYGAARTVVDIAEPMVTPFIMGELAGPEQTDIRDPKTGQLYDTPAARAEVIGAQEQQQATIDEQMARIREYEKRESLGE